MISTATFLQPLPDCRDKALAGGKAVNLGVLLRAGFQVPDGFVVTTDAYRHWSSSKGDQIPADLVDQIVRAYRGMGSPAVAVRSSATAEDMSEASMAGQYETYLDILDEHSLLNRIRCCWASLDSPRTRAYLKEHGIELSQVAMAVVVQRLVPSDVSGVLFTANPQTGSRGEMLIEASWGLGESVVSGLVQPDVLRLERATGRVLHARIADKQVMIPPGAHEEVPVDDARRRVPCLKSADVHALWKLGLKAADHFGRPQDIEWGIADGQLYLLQSRPITTLEEAEAYEELLRSTRAELRALLERGRGPWVVHNLAETLPHPTPLTWSVMRRFMSGAGGFGAMYRQAGFEPSAQVCREGFLALIAGRVYMDASLCPEMFFENFPFKYDVAELRRNPDAAQSPPTLPHGPVSARFKMARRAAGATAAVHALSADLDTKLESHVIPELVAWVAEEKKRDLRALGATELLDLWRAREKRVMDEFAPQSLLPSLVSAAALAELKALIQECFWDEDADELAQSLSSAHAPDMTVRANAALYEVALGEEPAESWLAKFGHRAPDEFDLATPRWRECPDDLLAMARRLKDGRNPAELHATHVRKVEQRTADLRARLAPADRAEFDRRLSLARRYMRYREDGKFYLILGYDLLRDVALEAGRRLEIGEDVFLLTLEELTDALSIGFAPQHLIAQRKTRRRAEDRIPLPHVIDSTNLDSLGSPPQSATGDRQSAILEAFAISPGAAAGPVRIVRTPSEAGDLGDRYILVCPSTDPSWTPLFTNAAGLILERGGTLSHGAVVAREMAIPAVVLREACSVLRDGEEVTVDGRNGTVARAAEADRPAEGSAADPALGTSATASAPASRAQLAPPVPSLSYRPPAAERAVCSPDDPVCNDTRIDRSLVPPPPGRRERSAARLRNFFIAGWGAYLLLAFVLPEDVLYRPSMTVIDAVLWPLVTAFGKAGAVAAIAVALGALTMIGQRFLTDNARLSVAKRRAAELGRLAADLPRNCPRARALRALAGPVQMRVLGAAMVPMMLILGPMVMTFFWLPERIDPASWAAAPGSTIMVTATVRTDDVDAVALDLPPGLALDPQYPARQDVPKIRKALEAYREKHLKPSDLSSQPWEVREKAEQYRAEKLADLRAYLDAIPPQPVTWRLHTPDREAGRWSLTARADHAKPLAVTAVTGDRYPPAPAEALNTPRDPLMSLKVSYLEPDSKAPRRLWTPFAFLGHPHWDVGWLWIYLLAYLPAMYFFRYVLKVA